MVRLGSGSVFAQDQLGTRIRPKLNWHHVQTGTRWDLVYQSLIKVSLRPGSDWHQGRSVTRFWTKSQPVQFALLRHLQARWCPSSETWSWSRTCRFMMWLSDFFLASCSCRRSSCDKPPSLMESWCVSYLHSSLFVLPRQACSRVSWLKLQVPAVLWGDPGNPSCDITMTSHHLSDERRSNSSAYLSHSSRNIDLPYSIKQLRGHVQPFTFFNPAH